MRIFYLVPYAPTPIRTRPNNLIRTLARRGHQVTLATCWEKQEEKDALEEFSHSGIQVIGQSLSRIRIIANLTRSVFSDRPLQSNYSWNSALLERAVNAITNSRFDIVQVEHLRGARYAQKIKSVISENRLEIPVIWDSVDSISHLFSQAAKYSRNSFGKLISRLELSRTKKFEAFLLSQFDLVLVTSSVDADAFQRMVDNSSASPLVVIRNGVDLEYFSPDDTPRKKNVVLFSGKLSYHANVTAAIHLVKDIMPLVWQKNPEVMVQLAGKDPTPSLKALADSEPRVEVTGTVSDLRPFFRQATVAVAPMLYGAGIQNKVLEAMASGTPVVASSLAISGLKGVTSGDQLLTADNPEDFAAAILSLCSEEESGQKLVDQALKFVRRYHSWESVTAELEDVYRGLSRRADDGKLLFSGKIS